MPWHPANVGKEALVQRVIIKTPDGPASVGSALNKLRGGRARHKDSSFFELSITVIRR